MAFAAKAKQRSTHLLKGGCVLSPFSILLMSLYYPEVKKPVYDTRPVPTGCLQLNIALQHCGYPAGAMVDISGESTSGKTTLALLAIAEAQRQGHTAAYFDLENSFSKTYAKKLGVDLERLLLITESNFSFVFQAAHTLIHSQCLRLIVIDSVDAITFDGEIPRAANTLKPEMRNERLRSLFQMCHYFLKLYGCTCILINQYRWLHNLFKEYELRSSASEQLDNHCEIILHTSRAFQQSEESSNPHRMTICVKVVRGGFQLPGPSGSKNLNGFRHEYEVRLPPLWASPQAVEAFRYDELYRIACQYELISHEDAGELFRPTYTLFDNREAFIESLKRDRDFRQKLLKHLYRRVRQWISEEL